VVQSLGEGVRVTYGYVAESGPGIAEGVRVTAGQVVAISAGAVHLGVRLGETYVDPLLFFGWGRSRLVGPPAVAVRPGSALVGSGHPRR
jgi:hypothetical protein